MTETQSKIRALFLAGLMVLSVFAMTMAFSGSAAAVTQTRGNAGTWYTSNGTGTVADGANLFQGEDDVQWEYSGVSLTDFERSSGSDEGLPLEDPIPTDQVTGSYDDGAGNNLSILTPRITDHEIQLDNGEDIAGGTVPSDADNLTVWAEYNFESAEDLELTVTDESGLDVTGEVLTGGAYDTAAAKTGTNGTSGEVSWNISVANLDDDEEYTVELEGVDDLDFGDAAVSDTFTISSADDVSLSLEQTEVVQGGDVTFDIEGATEGNHHVVRVAKSDERNSGDASRIFRNAGDTVRSGVNNTYAWAVVEIDGGVGTGSLRTDALRDTDVDVEVTEAVPSNYTNQTTPVNQLEEEDTATLTVTEGEVSLENPSGFYVPGSEVTVNGTADEGIDQVSFWARDQGAYERVQIDGSNTTDVSGEEFDEEDVVLSDSAGTGGNDILSLPGTYRFAVVAGDPAQDTDNPHTLTTTQVARNISDTTSLRVSESDLEASATIINGMVAQDDLIDVEGVALGSDDVSVSFYGPRGNYDRRGNINVDSDGTFEEEDISVGGNSIQSINQGNVIMSVYTDGRDDTVGDGQISGYANFTALINDIVASQYTQSQVIDRIASETTEDTGSDDQSVVFQFRHTDAQTTVDDIVGTEGVSGAAQVGNDITVSGTTNRQPDDNAITIEAIDGPSSAEFPVETTEEWGTDGQWNVTLNTTGLEPGNYTMEADDGDSSDVMAFTLSEDAVSEQTPTPTETEEPTETATEEPTETATEAPATDTATETEGDTGPGFGVVVALIALVAAALLAVRRNN